MTHLWTFCMFYQYFRHLLSVVCVNRHQYRGRGRRGILNPTNPLNILGSEYRREEERVREGLLWRDQEAIGIGSLGEECSGHMHTGGRAHHLIHTALSETNSVTS